MANDPPKKRSGGSKKFQDASDQLRTHMALRMKVTRLSEMADRSDQVNSSIRELISGILVDLDKQGERFMTSVEDSATPSTEPPPPVGTPPSMKPTVMALSAMNARTFERTIRTRFSEAKTEADRESVFELLRRGIDNVPEYSNDAKLQALETELRR